MRAIKQKNFNIIITGVGGQGLITLVQIIDEAAFIEGYDVKSSELHGLSQRGGSVETHIRFGRKIYSPLISVSKADLIISLEMLEALRETAKAGKNTKFLINEFVSPFHGGLLKEEIKNQLVKLKNEMHIVKASDPANVYLLGYAVNKKLMPLKPESILTAIKKVIPEKYLDLNIKAFELAET